LRNRGGGKVRYIAVNLAEKTRTLFEEPINTYKVTDEYRITPPRYSIKEGMKKERISLDRSLHSGKQKIRKESCFSSAKADRMGDYSKLNERASNNEARAEIFRSSAFLWRKKGYSKINGPPLRIAKDLGPALSGQI